MNIADCVEDAVILMLAQLVVSCFAVGSAVMEIGIEVYSQLACSAVVIHVQFMGRARVGMSLGDSIGLVVQYSVQDCACTEILRGRCSQADTWPVSYTGRVVVAYLPVETNGRGKPLLPSVAMSCLHGLKHLP